MGVAHPKWTLEEFDRIAERTPDDVRLELIDGEIVVNPPPRYEHGRVCVGIILAIGRWQEATSDHGVLVDNFSLRSGQDSVGPDVAYWRAGREPDAEQARVEDRMPDLVVEVASPSTAANDHGPKRRSYLAAGVRELWLVDARAQTVSVIDEHDVERVFGEDDTIRSAVLPGFGATVATLLP